MDVGGEGGRYEVGDGYMFLCFIWPSRYHPHLVPPIGHRRKEGKGRRLFMCMNYDCCFRFLLFIVYFSVLKTEVSTFEIFTCGGQSRCSHIQQLSHYHTNRLKTTTVGSGKNVFNINQTRTLQYVSTLYPTGSTVETRE